MKDDAAKRLTRAYEALAEGDARQADDIIRLLQEEIDRLQEFRRKYRALATMVTMVPLMRMTEEEKKEVRQVAEIAKPKAPAVDIEKAAG